MFTLICFSSDIWCIIQPGLFDVDDVWRHIDASISIMYIQLVFELRIE